MNKDKHYKNMSNSVSCCKEKRERDERERGRGERRERERGEREG